MVIHEKQFDKDSPILEKVVVLSVQSVGNSEADTLFDSIKPGHGFRIKSIEHFCEGIAATASYDVKIGTTSALNAAETPTADTREDATLSSTRSDLEGTDSEEINLHCTTDGTGTLTGLKVKVTLRVRPAGAEPGS